MRLSIRGLRESGRNTKITVDHPLPMAIIFLIRIGNIQHNSLNINIRLYLIQ